MEKFLIVGLGNIGIEYAGTRHNIGFDVVDAFVGKHQDAFVAEKLGAIARIKLKGKLIVCLKPATFMNLSGKAVKYWMEKENISLEHILVIVDEIALPLDKIRVRPAGSDGGHNGLKSIQEMLGTEKYPRLRFGIGNDFPKGKQIDYVLGKWSSVQMPVVSLKISKCVELIESFVQNGLGNTMNLFNNLSFHV